MKPQTPTPSRRTVIKTTAAAGLLGGIGLTMQADTARAAVALDTLDVPDAGLEDADGEPAGIFVFVGGDYEYVTDVDPADVLLSLYHRDTGGGFFGFAETTHAVTDREASGTFDLSGDLFDGGHYAPSDFAAPGPGEATTVDVELGVMAMVRDADGTVLVKDNAERVVSITVTQSQVSATVGAAGQVAFQPDTDDPTPTPPA